MLIEWETSDINLKVDVILKDVKHYSNCKFIYNKKYRKPELLQSDHEFFKNQCNMHFFSSKYFIQFDPFTFSFRFFGRAINLILFK